MKDKKKVPAKPEPMAKCPMCGDERPVSEPIYNCAECGSPGMDCCVAGNGVMCVQCEEMQGEE